MTHPVRPLAGQRDWGSSAVEFALVLPLLAMFIFGIIDFGRLQYERIRVSTAAFEGARAAVVHPSNGTKVTLPNSIQITWSDAYTNSAVSDAVTAAASGLPVSWAYKSNAYCAASGTPLEVTVTRPANFRWYTPVFRLMPNLKIFTFKVSATGSYRCFSSQ